ncbi:MAG TPA: carboxymuconolactone decarboxylase family protein [Mycobacteriales bacterium]|jgi:alkylhydroperoxidase family enzyme|nr:carboxymuconolactone decarboxylase family protein [Mycobacteriales bacterium]
MTDRVMESTVVPLIEVPKGLLRKFAWRYSRKTFGEVVDPVRALAHHSGVLEANGLFEMALSKRWKALDPHLMWLAVQASSGHIGCSWCTDFGYYEGMQRGIDPRKVRDVPRWRDSDVYDESERVVLAYAEAATSTPVVVDDDLVKRLHACFSNEEIVELVCWIALENYRSRINAGLGLTSQGFAARCELAPAP